MKKLIQKSKPKIVAVRKPGRPPQSPKPAQRTTEEEPTKEHDSEFEEEEQEEDEDQDEEDDMQDETQNPGSSNQQSDSDKGEGHKSVRGPGHGNGGKFNASSTGHVGKPGGGDQESGGGGDEEKTYILGYGNTEAAKLAGEYYPREQVWQTLLDEAHAQEVYETEDYDRRIKTLQEDQEKISEVMQGKYDPDKLREDAKKINESRTDPEKVKEQAKAIQELRKKLYPQPHE